MTLTLGVAACGDDDEGNNNTNTTTTDTSTATDSTTTDSTTATETTATETTATETTATETTDDTGTATETTDDTGTATETTDDTTAPKGSCDNTADLAIIAADDPDPADIAQSCGLSCLSEGADAAVRICAQNCIKDGKSPSIEATGLSLDCAGCYADVVICAKNNCLAVCLDGGADCATCRAEKGCDAAFETCSGLDL